ncbi:MAG TPA: uracil phosphoribosyltransferase, partial [Spirochaetales bacterium]|nr:uracil phosphoribosyltransferase [Spirochaetales bacterium]
MNKVIRKARDLDGYLTDEDSKLLLQMDELYAKAMENFKVLSHSVSVATYARETENIVTLYNEMGNLMQQICQREERINVYSFNTPQENHAEASRLIAKLRDVNTSRHEFVYYTQRAYELLFNLAYGGTKNV